MPLGAWRGREERKWDCGGTVVTAECGVVLCVDWEVDGCFMGIWEDGSGEELVWYVRARFV